MCKNTDLVDERAEARFQRIRRRLRAVKDLLSHQGSVVASWQTHRGKRLGPYFRLAFRKAGRQVSVYLGASQELAERVRALLAEWEAPERLARTVRRARSAGKAALRACRTLARAALKAKGLYARGFKVFGWRRLQESIRASRAASRVARAVLGHRPSALRSLPSALCRPPSAIPLPCLGRGLP